VNISKSIYDAGIARLRKAIADPKSFERAVAAYSEGMTVVPDPAPASAPAQGNRGAAIRAKAAALIAAGQSVMEAELNARRAVAYESGEPIASEDMTPDELRQSMRGAAAAVEAEAEAEEQANRARMAAAEIARLDESYRHEAKQKVKEHNDKVIETGNGSFQTLDDFIGSNPRPLTREEKSAAFRASAERALAADEAGETLPEFVEEGE
jgi:hypothetical protein